VPSASCSGAKEERDIAAASRLPSVRLPPGSSSPASLGPIAAATPCCGLGSCQVRLPRRWWVTEGRGAGEREAGAATEIPGVTPLLGPWATYGPGLNGSRYPVPAARRTPLPRSPGRKRRRKLTSPPTGFLALDVRPGWLGAGRGGSGPSPPPPCPGERDPLRGRLAPVDRGFSLFL
jgi:hypothetical protein